MSDTGLFDLSDSLAVNVETDGQLEVLFEGRPLWTRGAPFQALSFRETIEGPFAVYDIERTSVSATSFSSPTQTKREDDVLTLEFEADDTTLTLTFRPGPQPDTAIMRVVADERMDSVVLSMRCDAQGSFHGFGAQYNATDQRGESFSLLVSEQGIGRQEGGIREFAGDAHTTYFPMPYWLDAQGRGALIRTDHRVDVDLCATDQQSAFFEVLHHEAEVLLFAGPTPADVVRQLANEVGKPKRPPSWAFGTWISAQGGRDAVMADVDALSAAGIDIAAIWSQDWTGVRRNALGGFGVQYRWREDQAHYPQLAQMISELHERGIRFLAYANPFVDPDLPDHFERMQNEGWLLRNRVGEPYVFAAPNGESAHPDLTNPAARAYVSSELLRMVQTLGIDGWMADFGEWTPYDAVNQAGIAPGAYHNRFPVDWHTTNREAMEAARPDGDWVLFGRSGWRGVQAVSMIHWIGDQEANFSPTDGLPTVVPAMLNLGLSAVPYTTHDIGGFSGGPSTKELYLRWTELGAFTPIMRTHEGNNRDQNWNWDSDPQTVEHFRRFSKIHDALGPLWLELRDEAEQSSLPMVRHLLLKFGQDREVWGISDQFMLGDQLLVAPVVNEAQTTKRVYLPEGQWYHIWSGDMYEGPQRVTVDAPIGAPPVFSLAIDRPELRAIQ